MKKRLTIGSSVAIAAMLLCGAAWQAAAQQNGRDATAEQKPMMQCPMMAAMKNLQLHADNPAVLLAIEQRLDLTAEQKQQLKRLTEDVREQAKDILTDQQQQELASAPQGPLSVMEVAKFVGKGQDAGNMQKCPMCAEMMQKMQRQQNGQEDQEDHSAHHDDRE